MQVHVRNLFLLLDFNVCQKVYVKIHFYVSFLLFNWNVQLLYDRQAIFVIESI